MHALVLGDGPLGVAIADLARRRGWDVRLLGRPRDARGHPPDALAGADVTFEASRAGAVLANLTAALDGGCHRFVVATTGWNDDRDLVRDRLIASGASAVAASNFSLGASVFGRLVETAATLFAAVPAFEPFVVEWHRRDKRDRPSGTARDLVRRITDAGRGDPSTPELEVASIRAGSSPGQHLVAFDAPGETVELRLTARDRSTYAAGAVAAAEWLLRQPRAAGIHPFETVVDDLLAAPEPVATPA